MSWKQSKRRSPLFLNKTRFWLSFCLEIPFFFEAWNFREGQLHKVGNAEEREKGT